MKFLKFVLCLISLSYFFVDVQAAKYSEQGHNNIEQQKNNEKQNKNMNTQDWALDGRVSGVEDTVSDHEMRVAALERATGVDGAYSGTPLVDCCDINNRLIGEGCLYKTIIFDSGIVVSDTTLTMEMPNNLTVHATPNDMAIITPKSGGSIVGITESFPNLTVATPTGSDWVIDANVVVNGLLDLMPTVQLVINGDLIVKGGINIAADGFTAKLTVNGNVIFDGLCSNEFEFANWGFITVAGNKRSDGNIIIRNYTDTVQILGPISATGFIIFKNNKGADGDNSQDGDYAITIDSTLSTDSFSSFIQAGSGIKFIDNIGGSGGGPGLSPYGGSGGVAVYIKGNNTTSSSAFSQFESPTSVLQVKKGNIEFLCNQGGTGGDGDDGGSAGDAGHAVQLDASVGESPTILQTLFGDIIFVQNNGGLGSAFPVTGTSSGGDAVHIKDVQGNDNFTIESLGGIVQFIKNTGGNGGYNSGRAINITSYSTNSIGADGDILLIRNSAGKTLLNGSNLSAINLLSNFTSFLGSIIFEGNCGSDGLGNDYSIARNGGDAVRLDCVTMKANKDMQFLNNIGGSGVFISETCVAGGVGGNSIQVKSCSILDAVNNIVFAKNCAGYGGVGCGGEAGGNGGIAVNIDSDLNNALNAGHDVQFYNNQGGFGGGTESGFGGMGQAGVVIRSGIIAYNNIQYDKNFGGSGGSGQDGGMGGKGVDINDSANLNACRNILYENNEGGNGGCATLEAGNGAPGVEIHISAAACAFNDIAYLCNVGGDGGESSGTSFSTGGCGGAGVFHQGLCDQASHNIHFEANEGGEGIGANFLDGNGGHGIHLSGASLQACNNILCKKNAGVPGGGTIGYSGDGVAIESGSFLIASNNISFIHNQSFVESGVAGVGVQKDCSAQLKCSYLNYVVDCSSNNEDISGEPVSGTTLLGFYDGEPAVVHKQNVGSCMISACP